MNKNHSATTFKRIEVGHNFIAKGQNYRKVSQRGAYRLKENGRGETHAEIPFARSTSVFA